jgi:S1-C subfamily serine protease
METLTKQQLILLVLLVTFVSSITTGIVTVSLMDQAPPAMTQTINRIVERTVERVVPAAAVANVSNSSSKDAVITKETVVVKDDDMVIASVEKNKGNIIRVIKVRNEFGTTYEKQGGIAIPINDKGLLVSDISVLQKKYDDFGMIIPESYKALMPDGTSHVIVPVGADQAASLVFFEPRTEEGKPEPTAFGKIKATLADSNKLKLGQSVVALGGTTDNVVSTGIVSALSVNKDKSDLSLYNSIKTSIQIDGATPGTVLLNLSGEIVGMLIGRVGDGGTYLPSNYILGAQAI